MMCRRACRECRSARPWTRIQVYNWCPISVLSISSRPTDSDPISIAPVPRHTSTSTADTITSSTSARSLVPISEVNWSCHFDFCDSDESLVLTVRPVRVSELLNESQRVINICQVCGGLARSVVQVCDIMEQNL